MPLASVIITPLRCRAPQLLSDVVAGAIMPPYDCLYVPMSLFCRHTITINTRLRRHYCFTPGHHLDARYHHAISFGHHFTPACYAIPAITMPLRAIRFITPFFITPAIIILLR